MAGVEGICIKARKVANRATAEHEHFRKEKGCESNIEAEMIGVTRSTFVWSSE
jgi:hypothetical protein